MKNTSILLALALITGCAGTTSDEDASSASAAFSDSDGVEQAIRNQGADDVARRILIAIDNPQHVAGGSSRPLHSEQNTAVQYCKEFGLDFDSSRTSDFSGHENTAKYDGGHWDKNSNRSYTSQVSCAVQPFSDVNLFQLRHRIQAQGAGNVSIDAVYRVRGPRHRADGATRYLFPSRETTEKYCQEFNLQQIGDASTATFASHTYVAKYTSSDGWDRNNNLSYVQSVACGTSFGF